MASTIQWPDFGRLNDAIHALAFLDASPLMVEWRRIIYEGNRRGVMAGLDGNNRPMWPLRYRNGKPRKASRDRKGRNFGRHAESAYGNLTTSEYRRLTGPRLAPRGLQSRVITNLDTAHGRDPGNANRWFAVGAWDHVVSAKGFHFLPVHFEGSLRRQIPRYDLRPVRPEDRAKAGEALRAWAKDSIKKAFKR